MCTSMLRAKGKADVPGPAGRAPRGSRPDPTHAGEPPRARTRPRSRRPGDHPGAPSVRRDRAGRSPITMGSAALPASRSCAGSARRWMARIRATNSRGLKGLGQVIVGPHLQPHDPVHIVAAGGQHQHRHARPRSDPPQHFKTADARQHDVKDHQRMVARESPFDTPLTITGDCLDLKPFRVRHSVSSSQSSTLSSITSMQCIRNS